MTCTDNVCGTGGYTGPQPGDPDSNSILTATPAFGGIDLSWSPPGLNPHAVAFTRIFRSLSDDFQGAIFLADAGGTFYYDKIDEPIRYYYWITFYSANTGQPGEWIGPATAIARPSIAAVIEGLTAQIDAGMLAQSLKTEIDRITLLDQAITQEQTVRIAQDAALATTLTQVQSNVDDYAALLNEEVTTRATGQSALASAITTVQATAGDNLASVQTTLQTNIDTVDGKVTNIGARYTATVDVNGLVGGFGVYNDGSSVDAGFSVDTFWVGRTSADKRKPFIVSGGQTYIDEAVINKLTFDKLRAADGSLIVSSGKVSANYLQVNNAQSDNYVANAAGWRIAPTGFAEFYNIKARGDIQATSLNAATGSFSGSLSAATGTFAGSLTAGAINAVNTINIAGNAVTIPASAQASSSTQGYEAVRAAINSAGGSVFICAFAKRASGASFITFDIIRDGVFSPTMTSGTVLLSTGNISEPLIMAMWMDQPGAGSHSYSVRTGSGASAEVGIFVLECRTTGA